MTLTRKNDSGTSLRLGKLPPT